MLKRYKSFIAIAVTLLLGSIYPMPRRAIADSASPIASKQISQLLSNLNDDRSSVREEASWQLWKLHRSDLPALKQALAERMALRFDQEDLIRGVVEHVYLAEAPYAGDPAHGFLGVFELNQDLAMSESGGVEISYRIPGFTASRYLEDGDLVLSITGPWGSQDVRYFTEMRDVVARFNAKQMLTFKVLRRGRILLVPLVLDAKPVALEGAAVPGANVNVLPDFINERQKEADAYWNETFAPLFDASSSAHAASR